ncbi:MAG TPA: hypothetical protein VE010_23250, partial [Thermoanaerobaculia bacterium]|nr:hypothetical protein [Thermoanaerobaculia bacterium]
MIRTISLFLLLLVSVRSFAATHTWLGTVSDKVSEAANWSGGSPVGDPAAVLVFPAETARRAVTNDV